MSSLLQFGTLSSTIQHQINAALLDTGATNLSELKERIATLPKHKELAASLSKFEDSAVTSYIASALKLTSTPDKPHPMLDADEGAKKVLYYMALKGAETSGPVREAPMGSMLGGMEAFGSRPSVLRDVTAHYEKAQGKEPSAELRAAAWNEVTDEGKPHPAMSGCYEFAKQLVQNYPPSEYVFVAVGASADWTSQCLRQVLSDGGKSTHGVVNIPISSIKEYLSASGKGPAWLASQPFFNGYIEKFLDNGDPAVRGKKCVVLDVTSSGSAIDAVHLAIEKVHGKAVKQLLNRDDNETGTFTQTTNTSWFRAAVKQDSWKDDHGRAYKKVPVSDLAKGLPSLTTASHQGADGADLMRVGARILGLQSHLSALAGAYDVNKGAVNAPLYAPNRRELLPLVGSLRDHDLSGLMTSIREGDGAGAAKVAGALGKLDSARAALLTDILASPPDDSPQGKMHYGNLLEGFNQAARDLYSALRDPTTAQDLTLSDFAALVTVLDKLPNRPVD